MTLTRKTPINRVSAHKAALKSGEKKLRTRKCGVKGCNNRFTPRSITHKACGPDCAAKVAESKREKDAARATKVERQVDAVRKEALMTIPELKALAQKAFNAFIRERDKQAGFPCISSQRPLNWSGNDVDAGHYRSTGSADHLRFNEDNCHAQSKQDNRYKAGSAVDYRIGLIERIGLERVEALESNNAVVKWTRDGLIAIRKTYQAKLKNLKESAK